MALKRGRADEDLVASLAFAVEAHGKVFQERKGTAFPYVIHPLRVAEILYRHGCDEDVVIAGMLHDTIEDAGVTAPELERRFGDRVARLVVAASEEDKTLPWRERKQRTIDSVSTVDTDGLLVLAADKIDNVRSLRETLAERGDETWNIFNAGKPEQAWYYRSLADALCSRDPENELFRTLRIEVDAVFPGSASA